MTKPHPATKTVTSTDMFGNKHQATVDELSWRPSAYGVVVYNHKILLAKYDDPYTLPGGGIHLGELPEAAVVREVAEETGITVATPTLLTATSNFFTWEHLDTGVPEHYQTILLYYACEYITGVTVTHGHESHEVALNLEPVWLPLDQLGHIKIGSSVNWLRLIKPLL